MAHPPRPHGPLPRTVLLAPAAINADDTPWVLAA